MSFRQKVLVVLTTGADQNFLGQRWIPWVLRWTPRSYRRAMALRLLAISPHYFIFQWSTLYPRGKSRSEILEAEHLRNAESRRTVARQVLAPYLDRGMAVLDYGCGPGYLARAVSDHVKDVLAVDISAGALACAREINAAPNLRYLLNSGDSSSTLQPASVDLAYTFAVIQHVTDEVFDGILGEIHRVLRPGGRAILHVAGTSGDKAVSGGGKEGKFHLRMLYRPRGAVLERIRRAGFAEPEPVKAPDWDILDDDFTPDQLWICPKPARESA